MKKELNIIILDYGVGNLCSITKALDYFGVRSRISKDSEDIKQATHLILPGVGSFEAGMNGLKFYNLVKPIKNFVNLNRPILGICLGAQLLLSKGYEFGEHEGLNLISGKVIKFPKLENNEKIPQIGWNKIYLSDKIVWNDTILENISNNSEFYFVHSYVLKPDDKIDILSLSKYGGYEFCSAFKKNNIYGCQFHPEKSGEVGLNIIKNFINL